MLSPRGKGSNSQISGSFHKCIWWGCSKDLGKLQGSLLKVVINIQKAGGIYACTSLFRNSTLYSHWLNVPSFMAIGGSWRSP